MKVKKICFITATRAEYGQIAPVMRILKERENVNKFVFNSQKVCRFCVKRIDMR